MSTEIVDLKQRVERFERYLDTLEYRLDLDEMQLEMALTRPVSTGADSEQGGEGPSPDLILGRLESMLRSVLLNQTGHSAELRRATRNLGTLVDRGLSRPTTSKLDIRPLATNKGDVMTDGRDDFAEWRDSIESRVSTLETTVETQAEVRAGMDKDISDLSIKYGAQKQLLEALRETQSEHTATLRGHTDILRDHTERLERLEVGQATVLVGVQTIIGLLDRDIDGGSGSGAGNPGSPG